MIRIKTTKAAISHGMSLRERHSSSELALREQVAMTGVDGRKRRRWAVIVRQHQMLIFLAGIVSCLAIALTAYFINDRRQRLAFIASLTPQMRDRLSEFETSTGDWKAFQTLQQPDIGVVSDQQRNCMRFPPA